jgi:proline iminopeptidase
MFLLLLAAAACVGSEDAPGGGRAVGPAALPDDGFVEVRGARLAYDVIGGGPGVPALFIHGGPGGTGCSFTLSLDSLSRTRPVIVYDQIGSGYSSRIPEDRRSDFTDFDRFLEEIDALRAELGLEEVHLVGSSWGTAVALEYLLEGRSEGVRSVTFVGPYFSTERWLADTDELIETLSEASRIAIAAAVANGDFDTPAFEAADREFASRYGIRTPRDQIDWGACDLQPAGDSGMYEFMWGPSEFVSTGTLQSYDRIDRLSEVSVPTLFVRGEYDEPSHATVAEYQSRVPGARYETIPDAGHGVYIDQPQRFDSVVVDFLAWVEGA